MVARVPPLPPHPGPQPSTFEFPFAEAAAAKEAMEDLSRDLRSLVRRHRGEVGSARVDFVGRTRRDFDRSFSGSMTRLESLAQLLDDDVAELEAQIKEAKRRQREAQDAMDSWQTSIARYVEAQAQALARSIADL